MSSTSPTESQPIEARFRRNSTSEVLTADAYNRGGNRTTRTSSGSSSGAWTKGSTEPSAPAAISRSGADHSSFSASHVTASTARTKSVTVTTIPMSGS
ncbi:MAG TPA: hypothetical protein PKN27_03040 [Propionibacteriaceae bacterium]|nr:hypothetical protein [Propionibacteriaceae bacterium]